jgi:class 3 adenylate cyclase
MAQKSVQRRLAAILAADMVGYSRLMGADAAGTVERQKTSRKELIDPIISSHRGRVFKTTGDGFLVEFSSIVDAATVRWRFSAIRAHPGLTSGETSLGHYGTQSQGCAGQTVRPSPHSISQTSVGTHELTSSVSDV